MQTQHLSSFHVEFGRKPLRFDSRDKQVFYDEVCGCIMLAKKGDFSFVSFRGVHGQETHVYRYLYVYNEALISALFSDLPMPRPCST